MSAKRSPITPAVLAWAISEDGRTHEQIAEALEVDVAALDAWMVGDDSPTVGQVTALAKTLNRPRAMFFLPRPPESAALPTSFRHPPGDDRQVGPEARQRVRQARRLQSVIAEVLADSDPVEVPRFDLATRPDQAARAARDWLGVTHVDQAAWRDDYEALRAWRVALDSRGIFVFALEIGERSTRLSPDRTLGDEVRGFSAWGAHAPLIVMNSRRISAAARSYTLGHELGHLVTRIDAACVEGTTDVPFGEPVERWCEEFAAALLMPEPDVRAEIRTRRSWHTAGDLDDVRAMMKAFRVSARASALRLIDLGLAERRLYRTVEQNFQPSSVTASGRPVRNPPRSTLRLRQFGPRALDTVLRDVDPLEALSILRMTVPDVRELAEQVPSAAVL